jgi:dimethylglycine dehydrogenase
LAYQIHLWESLMQAGAEFDIRPYGIRAMDSLRIEKSYKYWRVDLSTEYTALEAGLGRFVHLNKGEFVGREALVRQQQKGLPRNFVTLACEVKDADPLGNEPIWQGKRMVGRATSGAYGYSIGKSLAVGYVEPDVAAPGTKLEIEILSERFPATVVPESPWDPENARLRG